LKYHQAKKIIFVFLVLSLVSSLSAVTFVTGNNLAFASKKNGGSGSGGSDGGGSKNNKGSDGGGSGDNGGNGGDSGDNTGGGGTTTTEGTDNNKNNADTGTTNTQPPPPEDQKTCPDGSAPDDSGKCPGTTQANGPVDGTGTAQPAQGLIGPALGGAPDDIPTKKLFCGQGNRFDVKTNQCIPVNAPVCPEEAHVSNGYCVSDYFSLDNGGCVIGRHPGKPDLGRTFCDQDEPTKTKTTPTTPPVTPATTDTMTPVKCGKGTHTDPTDPKLGQCTVNDEPLPNGACAAGWHFGKDQSICFKDTTTTPAKNCAAGSHYDTNYRDCIDDRYPILSKTGIGSTCIAGYHLEADKLCHKDTITTSQPNQLPTQTGGTTTTGNPATTNTNVNRGSSSGGGGSSTTAATSPAQANNNFLTYVNSINKISIKYPSAWTKTEFAGNPSIPVMFNAPITAATTTAAKTSFVISITPSASNLDSFTEQQINGLTQSNTVKYTITDSNAKLLTPPNGITAFHEISYDGIKTGNNIPLKGAAIFFVNGGTGYSLLYLAKQTEYSQNLPIVQQMVNSFQVGTSGGPVQNVAAANSSPR
jgi:hypothetical protein